MHRELVNTMFAAAVGDKDDRVLLPTGVARVLAQDGSIIRVRIVLDQCSQASYVTENLVQKLGWKKTRVDVKVTGVGEGRTAVKSATDFKILLDHPMAKKKEIEVNALIVKRVTGKLPKLPTLQKIEKSLGIKFADAESVGGTVSILLGSDICPEVFCEGLRKLNGYLMQNTFFGWIVSGGKEAGERKWLSTHVSLAEVNNLQNEDQQEIWEMVEKLKKTEDDIMKTFDVKQHSRKRQIYKNCPSEIIK